MKRREFLRKTFQVLPAAVVLAPLAGCEKKAKTPSSNPPKSTSASPTAKRETKLPFEWKGSPPPNNVPAVSPGNATAKALGYNPYAEKVDASKFKKYKKGNQCSNCNFYKALNKEWGKCQLLPNGAVTHSGWCKTWVKKA